MISLKRAKKEWLQFEGETMDWKEGFTFSLLSLRAVSALHINMLTRALLLTTAPHPCQKNSCPKVGPNPKAAAGQSIFLDQPIRKEGLL